MKLKVVKIIKGKDHFSLIFEKPKGFIFYPGQYLDIKLGGNTRAFTISSSPNEDYLMFTTRKGISDFKKALEKLKSGDTIATSHPAGTFILDESSPAVFLAGGIGITPFRSIIKYAVDKKLKTPITLIYLNSDEDFPFKGELDKWKNRLNLNIIYHNTNQNGHLTKLQTTNYKLPIFYLAGPPGMVDAFEKMLLDLGVDEVNIRYDRFDGY